MSDLKTGGHAKSMLTIVESKSEIHKNVDV